MQIGLLWYDDDPRKSLDSKIEQAAERYCQKYGCPPNACYVNPALVGDGARRAGLRVLPARSLRPNYLWIGIDDSV
jgi:hypothetical protein